MGSGDTVIDVEVEFCATALDEFYVKVWEDGELTKNIEAASGKISDGQGREVAYQEWADAPFSDENRSISRPLSWAEDFLFPLSGFNLLMKPDTFYIFLEVENLDTESEEYSTLVTSQSEDDDIWQDYFFDLDTTPRLMGHDFRGSTLWNRKAFSNFVQRRNGDWK